MKLKLIIATLAAMTVLSVSAQETKKAEPKKEYLQGEVLKGNWFVSVNGGVENVFTFKAPADFDLGLGGKFGVSVGRWITPYVGLSLSYDYASVSGTSSALTNRFVINSTDTGFKAGMSYIHGDILFNLTNVLCGYKEGRFYEAIPYLGTGLYIAGGNNNTMLEYNHVAGLINSFKVSDILALNLNLSTGVNKLEAYGESRSGYTVPVGVTVGATLDISKGGRHFKSVEESDTYGALVTKTNALEEENSKIKATSADLKAKNKALASSNSAKDSKISDLNDEIAELKANSANLNCDLGLIFFETGITKLTNKNLVTLKYIADFIIGQPNSSFSVEGYADSKTGSAKRNQYLSEKRAQNIYDALVNTYGVNPSQIVSVVGMGGVSNATSPELDRVSIIKKAVK